jgi:hypothetical protein
MSSTGDQLALATASAYGGRSAAGWDHSVCADLKINDAGRAAIGLGLFTVARQVGDLSK